MSKKLNFLLLSVYLFPWLISRPMVCRNESSVSFGAVLASEVARHGNVAIRMNGIFAVQAGTAAKCPPKYYSESEAKALALDLLQKRLSVFDGSRCATAFSALQVVPRPADFFAEARRTKFVDARRENPESAKLTQHTFVGNDILLSVSETVGSARAITIRGPRYDKPRSFAILLGDFFGACNSRNVWSARDTWEQQNTLMHEMVHVVTRWDDAAVFDRFYSHGLRRRDPYPGNTYEFTDWLMTHCSVANN